MSIRSCKLATILLANFCISSTSTHHCFINPLGQVTYVSHPSLCIHPFGEEQPSRRESPNFQAVSANSTEDSWLITTAWFLSHPQLIKSHYKIATVKKVLFCFLSLILSFKPPIVEEYSWEWKNMKQFFKAKQKAVLTLCGALVLMKTVRGFQFSRSLVSFLSFFHFKILSIGLVNVKHRTAILIILSCCSTCLQHWTASVPLWEGGTSEGSPKYLPPVSRQLPYSLQLPKADQQA